MIMLRRLTPHLSCVLVLSLLNLFLAPAAQASQLRGTLQPSALSSAGSQAETRILELVHQASRVKKLEDKLIEDSYSIQYRGTNRPYYKIGNIEAVSFMVESESAFSSEERTTQGGTVPVSVTCIIEENSGEVVDYFLSRLSARDAGGYSVEATSDSLGLIFKYDITFDGNIESITIDASNFLGQNRGRFRVGSTDPGQGEFLHSFGSVSWSEAEATGGGGGGGFDWGAFWACVAVCGVPATQIGIYCEGVCYGVPVIWLCVLCLVGAFAFLAVCLWACYYY